MDMDFLSNLIAHLPIAVFWKDIDSRYLGCNQLFLDCEGLGSQNEIIGKTDFQMHWSTYAENYRASDQRILKTKKAQVGYQEYRLQNDGTKIWFKTSKVPLLDTQGSAIGILGCFLDISLQKEAETALMESEHRYRSLIEATNTGYVVLDSHGCVLDANPEYVRLSGHKKEIEIIGRTPVEWTAQYDTQRKIEAIGDLLGSKKHLKKFVVDYQYPNGSSLPVEISAAVVDTDQGKQILGLCQDISERNKVEKDLREKDKFLENVLDDMLSYVGILETNGRIIFVNNTPLRRSGLALADVQGTYFYESPWWTYSDETRDLIQRDIEKCAAGKTVARRIQARMGKTGGRWIWFSAHPVCDNDGNTIRLIVEGRDINNDVAEIKQVQAQLFEEKELLQITLDSIGDGVITTDNHYRIKHINPVAEKLIGWRLTDAKSEALEKVFPIIDEETDRPFEYPDWENRRDSKASKVNKEVFLVNQFGEKYNLHVSLSSILDQERNLHGVVLVFSDITEASRLKKELAFRASHDPLTDLVNRSEFEKRLQRALNSTQQNGHQHAVCYMDLDRFKTVNDSCGHLAGDELLRQISGLLQSVVRSRDTLARLGGDEFGLLMEHCSIEQVHRVAEYARKAIEEFQFIWNSKLLNVGISIGVVPITCENKSVADILRNADAACYAAKRAGRNQIYLHDNEGPLLVLQFDETE